jgi:hypothetical protein
VTTLQGILHYATHNECLNINTNDIILMHVTNVICNKVDILCTFTYYLTQELVIPLFPSYFILNDTPNEGKFLDES